MINIPGYETFNKIEQLSKGYSNDKKYYVETVAGKRLLLRISNISEYVRKKAEFEMIQHIELLNVPMPNPVDFGICNDGNNIFQLLDWCDGNDAETFLPRMDETEKYSLGIQAGQILRKIHTITAPETEENWFNKFKRKLDSRYNEYKKNGLYFNGDERILEYVEKNRKLIENRTQSLRHNDYHIGNMMISNRKLIIVDFNDYDFGDPWEEFIFVILNAQYHPQFSIGQINGYFENKPPLEFWQLLAYYVVSFLPTYISWSTIFGEEELIRRIKVSQYILNVCANTQTPVPSWYLNGKYSEIY